jgi:hypothetical protein
MWGTLGLWLGPTVAVIVAAIGNKWFGWFRPRLRRRVAIRRIAERFARDDSSGYAWQYERHLEHYLGGRDWREDWDKANSQDKDGNWYDARGPASTWRARAVDKIAGRGGAVR